MKIFSFFKLKGKKTGREKGFTLIEVIVAMAIFVISSAAISGIFSNIYLSYRKAKTIQADLEKMQFSMNLMAKELRTSSIASTTADTQVRIYNYSQGKCFTYEFSGTNLQVSEKTPVGANDADKITACANDSDYGAAVNLARGITTGKFEVVNSVANLVSGKVTVFAEIDGSVKIQTTVSLRDYAISEI